MPHKAAMSYKEHDLKPIQAMYADVTGPRTGPDLSKVHTECLNINECAIDDLNTCGLNGNCIGTVSKPEPLAGSHTIRYTVYLNEMILTL